MAKRKKTEELLFLTMVIFLFSNKMKIIILFFLEDLKY